MAPRAPCVPASADLPHVPQAVARPDGTDCRQLTVCPVKGSACLERLHVGRDQVAGVVAVPLRELGGARAASPPRWPRAAADAPSRCRRGRGTRARPAGGAHGAWARTGRRPRASDGFPATDTSAAWKARSAANTSAAAPAHDRVVDRIDQRRRAARAPPHRRARATILAARALDRRPQPVDPADVLGRERTTNVPRRGSSCSSPSARSSLNASRTGPREMWSCWAILASTRCSPWRKPPLRICSRMRSAASSARDRGASSGLSRPSSTAHMVDGQPKTRIVSPGETREGSAGGRHPIDRGARGRPARPDLPLHRARARGHHHDHGDPDRRRRRGRGLGRVRLGHVRRARSGAPGAGARRRAAAHRARRGRPGGDRIAPDVGTDVAVPAGGPVCVRHRAVGLGGPTRRGRAARVARWPGGGARARVRVRAAAGRCRGLPRDARRTGRRRVHRREESTPGGTPHATPRSCGRSRRRSPGSC